jgi:predicted dehydrogenase
MSGRKLRAAVIGLGIGKSHAKGYLNSSDADLVAVCDMNPERLQQSADEWKVEGRYVDYHAMFKEADLDVVSVCVPNALHAEVSIAAMEAGCHVICEKPMAVSVGEAEQMVAAAKRTGKQLMVCYNYRYRTDSQWMRRIIQSGKLGQIYHASVSWHRETGIPGWGLFGSKQASGGGAFIDLGVHIIDLALWVMDFPEALTVSGSLRSLFGPVARKTWGRKPGQTVDQFDVDDGGVAFIRLVNGVSMLLHVTWAEHTQPKEDSFRIEIQGTEGTVIQHVRHYGSNDTLRYFTEIESESVTITPDIRFEGPQSHEALVRDLMSSLRQGQTPATSGEQGLATIHILEALYQSSEQGHEIALT